MEREQRTDNNDYFFTRWLPATLTILGLGAYVFSGGANWKTVELNNKVNAENLEKHEDRGEKFEGRMEARMIRIENKQDIILSKLR